MRTIKIFLASSAELDADKKQFEIYINEKNIDLQNRGIFLELKTWKNFISSIKEGRSQDEYNEYIKECDITIFLFHTKLGQFTEEEFNNAHNAFLKSKRRNKKPHIFTYFRKDENESEEIMNFKNYIDGLDHFYDTYYSWDNLLVKFNHQLDKILKTPYYPILRYLIYYFLLPSIVLAGAVGTLYYYQSIDMTVRVKEIRSIPGLPFKEGSVTLTYGDKTESLNIQYEVLFKQIPSKFKHKKLNVKFEAPGYVPIDTSFVLNRFQNSLIILQLKRDNSLGVIFGSVVDEKYNPLKDVSIAVKDLNTQTDENGLFRIEIPFGKQNEEQRLRAYKKGYQTIEKTGAPSDIREWRLMLIRSN